MDAMGRVSQLPCAPFEELHVAFIDEQNVAADRIRNRSLLPQADTCGNVGCPASFDTARYCAFLG